MRVCPRCRAEYPVSERFCTTDGTVLVEELEIARIGSTVGNYHLDQILGRGGMGTVYSGEHIYIRKKVAVKVLHAQFAKFEEAIHRFLREARAASSINHPNIVDVTDFGPMPDGGVYFVMEYLDGTSLEDLIEREQAIELHRALNIANQISLALAAAHEKNIVHRDLKPENIMLIRKPGRRDVIRQVSEDEESETGEFVVEKENMYDFVKVLDFGIAKVLTPDELKADQTMAGAVFGTPEYMSPEAARGDPVDYRSDIYSLGVILFDMLVGRPPFEAPAAAEVLAMHISTEAPSARDTAPELEITKLADHLIQRCMAKSPDDRYQSMDHLRDELQRCFGTVTYKRNPSSFPGAPEPIGPEGRTITPEPRKKRLTEELNDWMSGDESKLSDAEVKVIAGLKEEDDLQDSDLQDSDLQDFAPEMTKDEEDKLADALDRAFDDE